MNVGRGSVVTGQNFFVKTRGAGSNPPSRFLHQSSEAASDDWGDGSDVLEHWRSKNVRVQTQPDLTRRLITTNRSPDIPFDQSINPYKGCEHGCIYCFARPTHAYLDLSPGLDFETRIFYKSNVREQLLTELAGKRYRVSPIAMGTNTDPYQPLERSLRVTRSVLEVALHTRHPVSIVTKGALVLRDLDLLSELAAHGLAHVSVSLTTLDKPLKNRLEPRTASPNARLKMIAELHKAGVPTGVMFAPIIPYINDHEVETMVEAAKDAGASWGAYILLRLPREVRGLFAEWLNNHYPERAAKVLNVLAAHHQNAKARTQWGVRMRGTGVFADLLSQRFARAMRKVGLDKDRESLRTDLFCPPRQATLDHQQLGLFD